MSIFGGIHRRMISSGWSKGVTSRIQEIQVPERLKGSLVEKWANYWKQLLIDYKEMIMDTGRWMRDNPGRTTVYGVLGTSAYASCKNNPSLDDFRDQFQTSSNQLIQVDESVQNPVSKEHLRRIELWFNRGVVRRLSLGVVSFIWIDDFGDKMGLYKANCEYLQPQYLTFDKRVIDVGFWNKFWILEKNMEDYDVNF